MGKVDQRSVRAWRDPGLYQHTGFLSCVTKRFIFCEPGFMITSDPANAHCVFSCWSCMPVANCKQLLVDDCLIGWHVHSICYDAIVLTLIWLLAACPDFGNCKTTSLLWPFAWIMYVQYLLTKSRHKHIFFNLYCWSTYYWPHYKGSWSHYVHWLNQHWPAAMCKDKHSVRHRRTKVTVNSLSVGLRW